MCDQCIVSTRRSYRCGSTKTLAARCKFGVHTTQQRRLAGGYVQSSRRKRGAISDQLLCL